MIFSSDNYQKEGQKIILITNKNSMTCRLKKDIKEHYGALFVRGYITIEKSL